jgi:type IV pilus assembly protein PilP
MSRQLRIVWFAAGLVLAASIHAQSPQAPTSAPPAEQSPAAQPKPAFSYDPAGRRDPFVSLLGRGGDPRSKASRPAGLGGILINEINLKGIMRDRTGFVAMVQGPDNKTYIVRPGDRLMDGTVKSILADAVVFSQDVNDPLSLVKQREIRKALRSEESRG